MAEHKNLNMFGTFLETLREAEDDRRKSRSSGLSRSELLSGLESALSGGPGEGSTWNPAAREIAEDPEALVLDLLHDAGPLPIEELIRRSGHSLKAVLGVLERLERFGLVARQAERGSDAVRYAITAAGRAAEESYHRPAP